MKIIARKRKIVVLILLTFAVLVALGASTVVSHSEDAQSGVFVPKPVSAIEEATIRDPRQGKPTEPAVDAAINAHARTVVAGKTWKIVSYRAKSGKLCAGVTWPGEGQEIGCASRKEWFARGPVAATVAARQLPGQLLTWENFVLSGIADVSRVRSIVLVSTDCSKRDIAIDSGGYFLDVTSSDLIARGIWPWEIVAYDRNGRTVQQITVKPEPPDTEPARAAGIKAPAVGAECA